MHFRLKSFCLIAPLVHASQLSLLGSMSNSHKCLDTQTECLCMNVSAILQACPSPCPVQIIFLDSDNVAITDPKALFDTAEYVDKGAVLWPDYWASSGAPDLQRILPQITLPSNTFESGQMVLNKSRCGLQSVHRDCVWNMCAQE